MVSRHKPCPACRALVDENESVCPYCGQAFGQPRSRVVETHGPVHPGLVTGYIIGVCVLFFILEMVAALGSEGGKGIWRSLLEVPGEILFQMGARSSYMVVRGEWWRLVVPVFLHGSLLHILFNTMALVQVGPLAEQAYGRSRFILIYVLSGVLGNVLGVLLTLSSPQSVGIGASGALFGLIGATGLYGHRRGDGFGLMIRRVMVQWGLYALIFGLLVRADNAAHVGGLVSGVILSFVVGDAGSSRRRFDSIWTTLAGITVIVTVLSFGLAVYGYTLYGVASRRLS